MTGLVTVITSASLLAACHAERLLLASSPHVWVALSGGADSTALLRALLAAELGVAISVTHVNHGVQPEAEQWAQHCRELCSRLGVPLKIHRVSPPANGRFADGFEAWARSQRYAHWRDLLGEGEVLLCAHHADDQAETVALRLLQGRIPLPIPRKRPLGKGLLLRPLLSLPGAPLRESLTAVGEGWLEDPSNKDTRILRNRVRALLPELAPPAGWHSALLRCGQLHLRRQQALAQLLERHNIGSGDPALVSANVCGELGRLSLSVIAGPVALQGVLACLGGSPGTSHQARAALTQLQQQAARGASSGAAQGGVRVGDFELHLDTDAGAVVIWRDPVFFPQALAAEPGAMAATAWLALPHGNLSVRFDHEVDLSLITVRPHAPADKLLLRGRWRRVTELLRSAGIPRWARSSYPCVVMNDLVLAVPALCASGVRARAEGWLADGRAQNIPRSARWQAPQQVAANQTS